MSKIRTVFIGNGNHWFRIYVMHVHGTALPHLKSENVNRERIFSIFSDSDENTS